MNKKQLIITIKKFIRKFFSAIGIVAILGAVANIDSVQCWLAQPRLSIEVIGWSGIRETSSFAAGLPVFDEFEVKLNIIPHVRFHIGQFPVNQVKGLTIKKGEWFGGYKIDREIPFNIKDEPIVLKLLVRKIPIEGANKGKNVEIKVIDLRGHISSVLIKNAF